MSACVGDRFGDLVFPAEIRTIRPGTKYGRCPRCGRLAALRSDGTLRKHSLPGRNTWGHDNTIGIAWDHAEVTA